MKWKDQAIILKALRKAAYLHAKENGREASWGKEFEEMNK